MATYPHCRECGADLTSHEEQEEGLCHDCLEKAKTENETEQG
jgi:primosomal protein N'